MPRGGSHPGERRGGRKAGVPNKATVEVRILAQRNGPAAIKEAARLMKEAESETARLAAINMILDRAYGKAAHYAPPPSATTGSYDLSMVSDSDLALLETILAPSP
jgi:hypothetical protein